jgi:hypothetical protein
VLDGLGARAGATDAIRRQGVSAAPAGSSNEALARPSLRHPVQNEQFYFVMPDRFEDGDDANARRETSP